MFMMSKILDIDIVHNFTIEEEVKIDKKTQAETTKELNRSKYKNLLTQTKELTADKLILTNFYEELNIDFTDDDFMNKFSKLKDKPYVFIDDIDQLKEASLQIKNTRIIGVDLEFCGDKRTTIASLLQISTIECDYIIDTLVLREKVAPVLNPIFNDSQIVKVFHGCDYDILLLLSDLDIEVLNVFDTARAFGFMNKIGQQSDPPMVSFEFLVNKLLNVKADKFFQVAEWRLRPLPKVMLNYCRADSHYLLYIYCILVKFMTDDINIKINATEEEWSWLKERKIEKWKEVPDQFTNKMSLYMIQRIEKATPRQYIVYLNK